MTKLGHFEQNLLTELRAVVADQAAVRRPRRSPVRRFAPAAAGAGLLAVGLLVGLPGVGGEQSSSAYSAYAVEANDDGTVTVTIRSFEDADGLERQLEAHGIAAEVDYVPPGTWCRNTPPRYEREPGDPMTEFVYEPDNGYSWTIRPADFRGRTLVIEQAGEIGQHEQDGFEHSISTIALNIGVAVGPVAPCELVDAK